MSTGYQPTFRGVTFDWIEQSWNLFASNAMVWIVSTLITFFAVGAITISGEVLIGASGIFSTILPSSSSGFSSTGFETFLSVLTPLFWLLSFVIYASFAFFYTGLIQMANAQVRGYQINIGMLFQGGKQFLKVLAVLFTVSIGSVLGLFACFVGTFFVRGLFEPALALAADGETYNDSLNKSFSSVGSDWLLAGLFVFVFGLIMGLGTVLTCGFGALVLLPMQVIVMSLAYRDTVGMPGILNQENPYALYQQQPGQWPPAPNMNLGFQPQDPPVNPQNSVAAPYMPFMNTNQEPNPYAAPNQDIQPNIAPDQTPSPPQQDQGQSIFQPPTSDQTPPYNPPPPADPGNTGWK